ncbi:hypothetical protein BD410DRAFT_785889 [Rickenella mellea]|uniref:Uncharacterized protein n=1 Tax=Rickenella mellea TaxID=50990 RepID=A0A4Y7QA17_9AGAM|nr:hypothetical protein BD410DRAFT_785889 [Rickenella mellea]
MSISLPSASYTLPTPSLATTPLGAPVPTPPASGGTPATFGFAFILPSNCPVCTPEFIQWVISFPPNFTGAIPNLDLYITGSTSPTSPNITQLIQIDAPLVDATPQSENENETGSYTWSQATVPPGTYVIQAFFNGGTAVSPAFSVLAGNTSCLAASSSSSAAPTQSPGTTSGPPSQTNSPQPSSPTAVSASHSGSKVASGAIAGIVVGALLIGALLAAFCVFRRRRRSSSSRSAWHEKGYGGLASGSFPVIGGSNGVSRSAGGGGGGAGLRPAAPARLRDSFNSAIALSSQDRSGDDLPVQGTVPHGAAAVANNYNYTSSATSASSTPQLPPISTSTPTSTSTSPAAKRRTVTMARKPVPAYLEEDNLAGGGGFGNDSDDKDGLEMTPTSYSPSNSLGTGESHGTLSQPRLDVESLSARPMHYLIPDLPSAQR